MKNLQKRKVRSLFPENKVRFTRAEQLWMKLKGPQVVASELFICTLIGCSCFTVSVIKVNKEGNKQEKEGRQGREEGTL